MNPLDTMIQTQTALNTLRPKLEKLKTACDALEANFAKDLIGAMRKGTKDVHFGKAPGGDIYQGMMDDALSGAMSKTGMLGIGNMVYKATASGLLATEMTAQAAAQRNPVKGIEDK